MFSLDKRGYSYPTVTYYKKSTRICNICLGIPSMPPVDRTEGWPKGICCRSRERYIIVLGIAMTIDRAAYCFLGEMSTFPCRRFHQCKPDHRIKNNPLLSTESCGLWATSDLFRYSCQSITSAFLFGSSILMALIT